MATLLLTTCGLLAGGVTAITHGLDGTTDGWISGMAAAVPTHPKFLGKSATCYKLYFEDIGSAYYVRASRVSGPAPLSSDSGELVLKLDWRQLADGDSYNTYQIATAFSLALQQSNLIPELGRALAEQPLHLIGHSRGGSLVCEMSRQLGTNGLWVDHVTCLDPHPLCDPVFSSLEHLWYAAVDAPAQTYMNVLFADNYYQTDAWFVYGKTVQGAFNRQLTALGGGYESNHSDTHLFYHGTLDWSPSAFDGEAWLDSASRSTWYASAEQLGKTAGFHYSRIGGGDRLSGLQPSGPYMIRDGYNQSWELGAGTTPNRIALPSNSGLWPNLISVKLPQYGRFRQGQTITVTNLYQWARPAGNLAQMTWFLDGDMNPYNANEWEWKNQAVTPSGDGLHVNFVSASQVLSGTQVPSGLYAVGARITGNGLNRYLYANEYLQVVPSNGCNHVMTPAVTSVGAAAGSATFTVSTAAGCDWSAASPQAWIHCATNGYGAGTIKVTFDVNNSLQSRTGTISIGTSAVSVKQAGCVFSLPLTATNIGSKSGGGTFTIANSEGCNWQAWAAVPWIHSASTGAGRGTVNFTADANSTAQFRTGTIVIGGEHFFVTQAPAGFLWQPPFGWVFDAGNSWFHGDTFGWLWFHTAGKWIWSSSLQGWLAITDPKSRTLWSAQFRWLTPSESDSQLADTTSIGRVRIGSYNGSPITEGWVVSDRFGYVWANGDGNWFYSTTHGWLGVTPEGGIWSVNLRKFL